MKKLAIVAAVAVALGIGASVPATVSASNLNDQTVVVREPGKSMVLSMRDVAGIFVGRYVKAAVHSIELSPDHGNYYYVVEGYTPKNSYKIKVDVITSKVKNEEKKGLSKKNKEEIKNRIFNPLTVIPPQEAEKAARIEVGGEAFSRGWKLEAEQGQVTYTVTIHVGDQKQKVVVDAKTGAIISKGKMEPIEGKDDGINKKKKPKTEEDEEG